MGNFMKSLQFISVLIFLTSLYAFTPKIFSFKETNKNNRANCGFYINKRTSELLQVRSSLNLKCDSTFIFLSNSCLRDEKSSGTWAMKNDSIFLTSDKKTLKLSKQNRKRDFVRLQYVDLSNNILTTNDSFLVWQHSANYIDTLQEAMTIRYDN
jgi:hypothetical protein